MQVCHCCAAINRTSSDAYAHGYLHKRPQEQPSENMNTTYIMRASGTARNLWSQIKHPISCYYLQGSWPLCVDHDAVLVSVLRAGWDISLSWIINILSCLQNVMSLESEGIWIYSVVGLMCFRTGSRAGKWEHSAVIIKDPDAKNHALYCPSNAAFEKDCRIISDLRLGKK